MKARCLNPKSKAFKDYGGRGITFAPEWIDFIPFRDYVNENLGHRPKGFTLDRRNNNSNYEPGNLRWAPRSVQNQNSRRATELTKFLNALAWEETL
jgi:hypothetical protein